MSGKQCSLCSDAVFCGVFQDHNVCTGLSVQMLWLSSVFRFTFNMLEDPLQLATKTVTSL